MVHIIPTKGQERYTQGVRNVKTCVQPCREYVCALGFSPKAFSCAARRHSQPCSRPLSESEIMKEISWSVNKFGLPVFASAAARLSCKSCGEAVPFKEPHDSVRSSEAAILSSHIVFFDTLLVLFFYFYSCMVFGVRKSQRCSSLLYTLANRTRSESSLILKHAFCRCGIMPCALRKDDI